ncbi:MAG: low specificity L-threonine aldolase [Calditrichaeota bacterium]|nr:low specificity L-threonine aldolase [Calditrichota bacterium]RQW03405.1 MAG: low specificity L-threonine aldolase [Calditrichota bacterium]
MQNKRGFASDNNAGIHPEILKALEMANDGHVIAYGDDPYTEKAIENFRRIFGKDVEVFFVFNGTAANVLGITAITRSFHAIICSDLAHLNVDECGAPEKYTGCKLLIVPSPDGKLTPDGVAGHLHGFGFEHHAQPKVVSITQATEMGTVYTPYEITALAELAHSKGLYLHMDGARIANAAVSLGRGFREITVDAGVDILSFGGTKNGVMLGEAIIFFNPELSRDFKYIRKQGMQLGSKMRFISAQFSALLENDLWRQNAEHANEMAQYLAEKIEQIPEIKITQLVQANAVFAIFPAELIPELQKKYFFYVWNEATCEVRWMTSFDTTREDVDGFVAEIQKLLGYKGIRYKRG